MNGRSWQRKRLTCIPRSDIFMIVKWGRTGFDLTD